MTNQEPEKRTGWSEEYADKTVFTADMIIEEVRRAKLRYPENFNSEHEAYAVILEEIDELWDEIKKKQSDYDRGKQRNEAIQAAAMLVRLLVELL